MDDITTEVEAVKKELVELIIEHLREKKLDEPTARKLASDFLAALPITTHKELLEKLKQLGEKYTEAKELYVERLSKESDKHRQQVLNQMRDHIKSGNIEHAITAAKSMQQTGV